MTRERAVAPSAKAERRPWPQLRRVQLAAVLLLIIGIPGAVYVGGLVMPLMRSPVTRMVTTDFAGQNVVLGPTSSITLARGSRLVYNDKANANGRQELVLMEGQGMFSLAKHPKGAYVVTTPAGRILVTGTKFHVEVRDPELTFVMVEEGTVSLESVGAGSTYAPLQLRAGDRGLLMWGQPPQRAN